MKNYSLYLFILLISLLLFECKKENSKSNIAPKSSINNKSIGSFKRVKLAVDNGSFIDTLLYDLDSIVCDNFNNGYDIKGYYSGRRIVQILFADSSKRSVFLGDTSSFARNSSISFLDITNNISYLNKKSGTINLSKDAITKYFTTSFSLSLFALQPTTNIDKEVKIVNANFKNVTFK